MKILGQGRQAAGKVGIGNLDQAKFGHATFLPLRLYILTEVGTMTKFWKAVHSCHRSTAVIIREGAREEYRPHPCATASPLSLEELAKQASRRMDTTHGLAAILRDAAKRPLLRMRKRYDASFQRLL